MLALTLVTVVAPLPGADAESISSHATIKNAPPRILSFDVLFDARLGAFLYNVTADDGNGDPDLDRAVFHITDPYDRLWTHRDDQWIEGDGGATVSGLAHVGTHIGRGPFRVHLHVYDRLDAEVDADAPVTIISGPLDAVHDARRQLVDEPRTEDGPLILPLGARVASITPPQWGVVGLGAAFLLFIVGIAHVATRRPKPRPQRRSGGRLGAPGGAPPGGRRGG